MMERMYFVANEKGEIIGHDLSLVSAEQCLKEMQEREPNVGWEILESKDIDE